MFCVFLSESLNGLDSQLDPVGSTWRGARTGILRFMVDIFVYEWLLVAIIIAEIIIVKISILIVCH